MKRENISEAKNKDILYIDSIQYNFLVNRIKRTCSGVSMKNAEQTMIVEACGTESLDIVSDYWEKSISIDKKYRSFTSGIVIATLAKIQKHIEELDKSAAASLISCNSKNGTGGKTQSKVSRAKKNEKQIEKAYNSLPDELKKYVTKDDIIATDDGYFIITKSLADIMRAAGVDSADFNYEEYDDWYITGLRGLFGSTTYSMMKVREPMDADKQGHRGTTVPFVGMDISDITDCLEYYSEDKSSNPLLQAIDSIKKKHIISSLNSTIDDVVQSYKFFNRHNGNDALISYFSNPTSEGSYLIADFLVDKVANDAEFDDGAYTLENQYTEFDKYGQESLDYLAEQGIYDKETNTIHINREDGLSEDERNALLLITTGDSDVYSYAGENQFHADVYPLSPKDTIASDAGVGEDPKERIYSWSFKEDWGIYKAEQELFHQNHSH